MEQGGSGQLGENPQAFLRRESRRRNCLTETTRTPWRRTALITSRSRLRSSSRLTRYCVFPMIAASRISSSSGSRHIFNSPEMCTMVARAAINRTNVSTSWKEYWKRRAKRGLVRTSAISLSCESDVTTLNASRRHPATTCPGGPVGLRKAETQTFVSSRATSGTAFCPDLGPCSSYLFFNDILGDRFGESFHSAKQAVKVVPPSSLRIKRDQDTGLLLQLKGSEGSEHTFFVYGFDCLFAWTNSFWQRHGRGL